MIGDRVAAILTPQQWVADEGVPGDARAAKQEQPGNVGDQAAARSEVRKTPLGFWR